MKIKPFFVLVAIIGAFFCQNCASHKRAPGVPHFPPTTNKPNDKPNNPSTKPNPGTPTPTKPDPGSPPNNNGKPNAPSDFSGQPFRIALMLPFLTNLVRDTQTNIPEKSRLAVQFYGGASIALEKLSTAEGMNLTVDVYDTKSEQTDFDRLLTNPKLELADLYIGPIRSGHVAALANRTKMSHKPLISPESPNMDLTSGNPNFVQINPSLRSHCEGIARYINKKHQPDQVVLVCKQKESERLAYFQNANTGASRFAELVVPDATENFNNIDLKSFVKTGKTTVFVMPSWSSEDFVFAFFRKVKTTMGKNKVEVYGMPQWKNFQNIEPDYFQNLNVHISSATYINPSDPEVKAFKEKFYQQYGTIPDEDAYNGYDVTLSVGKMLKKYGKYFPEKLGTEPIPTLQGSLRCRPIYADGSANDRFDNCDYLENKFVHILKFDNYRFAPAE